MSRKSLVPIELPKDPVLPLEAATKQYVDAADSAAFYRDQDDQWKKSVQCATTGPIANLSNLGLNPTIDGVTITEGMRVLVKDQAIPAQNGIYLATNSPPWLLQRGYVVWQEVYQCVVAVDGGTVNHDTIWMSTADAGGTLNTTPVSFVKVAMQSDVAVTGAGPMSTWEASATGATDSITTDQDVVGCSVVVPVVATTDKFLVVMAANMQALTSNTLVANVFLNVGGVDQVPAIVLSIQSSINSRVTGHQNYIITGLTPGNVTFKMRQGANTTAGTWRVNSNSHTHFTVIKLEGAQGSPGVSNVAMDWLAATATTALPATTYVTVSGWARVAGVANPGYVTFTAGGVFTVQQAGLYHMNFSGAFSAGTDGRRLVLIFLNGVEDRRAEVDSALTCTALVSHCRYLSVGNTLEFKMYCTGAALAMNSPYQDVQFVKLA